MGTFKNILALLLTIIPATAITAQETTYKDPVCKKMCCGDTVFYLFNLNNGEKPDIYLNNKKLPYSMVLENGSIRPDKITHIEVKKEGEYGAVYISVPKEYGDSINILISKQLSQYTDTPGVEFPGGIDKMSEWCNNRIKYPEAAIDSKFSGGVLTCFNISADGSISNVKIMVSSKNEIIDNEALKITESLPKFNVKTSAGILAKTTYVLPLYFKHPDAVFIRGGNSLTKN